MSTYHIKYKQEKTFEERKRESERILSKYTDRIPVIVEKMTSKDLDIGKRKFLVPWEFNLGQFMYVLRKQIKLSPEKTMFVTINNDIPSISLSMYILYEKYKNDDGFLYIVYSTEENVFG